MSCPVETLIREKLLIPNGLERRCHVHSDGNMIRVSMWIHATKPADFVRHLGNMMASTHGHVHVGFSRAIPVVGDPGDIRFVDSHEFSLSDPELLHKVEAWLNERY